MLISTQNIYHSTIQNIFCQPAEMFVCILFNLIITIQRNRIISLSNQWTSWYGDGRPFTKPREERGEDLYSVIAPKVWKVPKVRPLKITRNCPRRDCLLVSSWGLSPKLMYILSAAATAESIFSSTCMCMCIEGRDRIHIASCFHYSMIMNLCA